MKWKIKERQETYQINCADDGCTFKTYLSSDGRRYKPWKVELFNPQGVLLGSANQVFRTLGRRSSWGWRVLDAAGNEVEGFLRGSQNDVLTKLYNWYRQPESYLG